jgi:hypothetical protein
MPTTHEFGPRGAYGDWEWHEDVATRVGLSYFESPEQSFRNSGGSPDNTTLRFADSVNVFETGALAPGVTIENVDYRVLAVDAGVNQVNDPVLESSRRKSLEREAMAKAVEDARLNAETLARAAGVRLGPVRALNGSSSAPPMPMYRRGAVMADAAMAPEATYQPGDMKFSAVVNAEYDLVVTP